MLTLNRPKPTVTRDSALEATPHRVQPRQSFTDPAGHLHLVVEFSRPRWQQRLGAPTRCERTFILDPLGREVYDQCSGSTAVRRMIARFAETHQVSLAEAEYSVTTYLQTLLRKGLIVMEVQKTLEESP